jgi:serine/threonine protein kinase
MHELTLIHTDLKPENILLVSSEYMKMPDYKVSKFCSSVAVYVFDITSTVARKCRFSLRSVAAVHLIC